VDRNKDYIRAGINYIVIHPEELKEHGISIKGNRQEFLGCVSYMVSEKLQQIKHRMEVDNE
jgi:hypothetical protein